MSSSEWPKLKHDRNEGTNDSARTRKALARADFEVSGAYYRRPPLEFLRFVYSLLLERSVVYQVEYNDRGQNVRSNMIATLMIVVSHRLSVRNYLCGDGGFATS